MKFKTLLTVILLLFVVIPVASAQQFVIESYHADISIFENGLIEVTETIHVDFHSYKHGLYREIPFRYVDELGDSKIMPVKVRSVTDEKGTIRKFKSSKDGNVINIRIGDAEKYVIGRQVYVIRYQVENALLYFEDHDELYWNVTGNHWRSVIHDVTANIHLRANKKSTTVQGSCYTGDYGSLASACESFETDDGMRFIVNRTLNFGEGFTVAFGWDKGIVRQPSATQQFFWLLNLAENWVFFVPFAIFIYMFSLWHRRGRDPQIKKSLTVNYRPPEINDYILTPAEVGTLLDETLDQRDFTASIIGLAVKGYIEIKEIEQESSFLSWGAPSIKLKKLKESDDDLTMFEKELMGAVFTAGEDLTTNSELKEKFYTKIPGLRDTIYQQLILKGFFSIDPAQIRTKYAQTGFIVMVAMSMLLMFLSDGSTIKPVFCGLLSGGIIIFFSKFMPSKTRLGSVTKSNILGFQEFMLRTDKDMLERMGKDIYYEYMPYAIALGVVKHWSDMFAGLIDEPPKWYVSTGGMRIFNTSVFADTMSVATSSLGSAMFTAPRGSGLSSGSGGFSGGGGGGGGGSW